ncbi:MAG: alpha-(1-2)-phosphatidylinositol mannosyltransferase, partial [Mycobacterium sp.]
RAVSAVTNRPEHHRRVSARRRAEDFTWHRAATGMLASLGAPTLDEDPGDAEHTA